MLVKAGHENEMDLVYDNGPSGSETLFNSSLMSVEVSHKVAHSGSKAKAINVDIVIDGKIPRVRVSDTSMEVHIVRFPNCHECPVASRLGNLTRYCYSSFMSVEVSRGGK